MASLGNYNWHYPDFYYPSTITGAGEANLALTYWDGAVWSAVRSTGGSLPAKDTTDNLDGTVSGGRFRVVFGPDSTPALTALTGTIFALAAPPVSPQLTGLQKQANGSFQFAFTNSPGAIFSAYGATNPFLPLSDWTFLGSITDSPPGQFRFTDQQATNMPKRFYRVRSP